MCWGKKSDFIRKATEPRRGSTGVLQSHVKEVQNSGSFLSVEGKGEGQEVMEAHRQLGSSRGPSKVVKLCPQSVDSS